MLTTKNLSHQYLAFLAALIIATIFSITLGLIAKSIVAATVCFIISLISIFYFLRYIFNWFIYRRIKLIYKLIYDTKASKKQLLYNKHILPQRTILEVEDEVEDWAIEYAVMLDAKNKNELYRRQFLQNLSHELKTPVFAIQGYIETILDGVDENFPYNNFLLKANSNVQRMSSLLNDLDIIAKLETGEQPLQKTKFAIQDIIKEVFDANLIHTQKNNITTQIKKGCEQLIYVSADANKIKQVLTNLVLNATKYGKSNGHIYAGIYKTDDNNVLIEISDDGIGIESEHLQRIFERFYRTDTARSRNIGGSGLGLAICKHIIEAHQHTIHARSQVNVGTTIGFTLSAANT